MNYFGNSVWTNRYVLSADAIPSYVLSADAIPSEVEKIINESSEKDKFHLILLYLQNPNADAELLKKLIPKPLKKLHTLEYARSTNIKLDFLDHLNSHGVIHYFIYWYFQSRWRIGRGMAKEDNDNFEMYLNRYGIYNILDSLEKDGILNDFVMRYCEYSCEPKQNIGLLKEFIKYPSVNIPEMLRKYSQNPSTDEALIERLKKLTTFA